MIPVQYQHRAGIRDRAHGQQLVADGADARQEGRLDLFGQGGACLHHELGPAPRVIAVGPYAGPRPFQHEDVMRHGEGRKMLAIFRVDHHKSPPHVLGTGRSGLVRRDVSYQAADRFNRDFRRLDSEVWDGDRLMRRPPAAANRFAPATGTSPIRLRDGAWPSAPVPPHLGLRRSRRPAGR